MNVGNVTPLTVLDFVVTTDLAEIISSSFTAVLPNTIVLVKHPPLFVF